MPFNTMLISEPAVGAAQILIWANLIYSCVSLPPMSTAIRTTAFSFVGALSDLFYIFHRQCIILSLPSWSCGFNLQFVHLVGRFWVFFLSHTAGFQLWFYSIFACGSSTGDCSWGCLEHLGLHLWWPDMEVMQLLGSEEFWKHQVLRGVGG